MEQFIVYIIYSSILNKFYTGYTIDLKKRLIDYNTGISTYTSKATDWVIKYTEVLPDRESAMRREREIKSKKSKKYIEWLINSPDNYQDG